MTISSNVPYPHLNDAARAMIDRSDTERIHFIRKHSWLGYKEAKRILAIMEDLLSYPSNPRMPNLLLVAPSHNGKTSILKRFEELHPINHDPDGQVTICPVVMIQSPPKPDLKEFYSYILNALFAPYRPAASPAELRAQVVTLFRQMGVRMLMIDEIQHLIAGGLISQRVFRNALKGLGNETGIVMVAAGVEDAYNAFNTDPQLSSRFMPEELPIWKPDKEFGSLLATLELRYPLKHPSNLKAPTSMLAIHTRSEGTLGDACHLVRELAVDAIRRKVEQITLDRINSLPWAPPSKRKLFKRL